MLANNAVGTVLCLLLARNRSSTPIEMIGMGDAQLASSSVVLAVFGMRFHFVRLGGQPGLGPAAGPRHVYHRD